MVDPPAELVDGKLCGVTLTEIEEDGVDPSPDPIPSAEISDDIRLRFQNLHERLSRAPAAMKVIARETGIQWPTEFDALLRSGLWSCATCLRTKLPTPN